MSEYFRVLQRLQAEEGDLAPRPTPAAEIEPQPAAAARPLADRAAQGFPPTPPLLPTVVSPAYAMLYDNLRATANGHPTRSLVFAGANATDPVRSVTTGVAAHVRRLGLRIIMTELIESKGRPFLRARPDECDEQPRHRDPLPLDLRSHAGTADIKEWLEESAGNADLVIVEGTALAQSIDSALLGCACDGLVIVVRTEVTPREALRVAVERSRAVGCRPVGIVMHGTKDHLPAWARRFFHHYGRPLTASEGS